MCFFHLDVISLLAVLLHVPLTRLLDGHGLSELWGPIKHSDHSDHSDQGQAAPSALQSGALAVPLQPRAQTSQSQTSRAFGGPPGSLQQAGGSSVSAGILPGVFTPRAMDP